MAAAKFYSEGKTFELTAPAAKTAGTGLEIDATDNLIGIYVADYASGEEAALAVEGVWEILKGDATDVITQGLALVITDTSGALTVAAAAGGAHAAARASANGDTTAWVKINVRSDTTS